MTIVTMTTDFGGPAAVMKGIIWGIAPDAKITDITWQIQPQNLLEAALILDREVFFFPDNSVHIVVVDPGVGTARRPVAAQIGNQYFVAPDNGVLSMLLRRAETESWPIKFVHTNKPRYWMPKVSNIYHGRDIFAPVGGHLAAGVPLEELGEEIEDYIKMNIPTPVRKTNRVEGEITIIYEHFGNLITNIRREDIQELREVNITLCGTTIEGMIQTFGERPPGTLVAVFDECDYLYISIVNGSAAALLNPRVGDQVIVTKQ